MLHSNSPQVVIAPGHNASLVLQEPRGAFCFVLPIYSRKQGMTKRQKRRAFARLPTARLSPASRSLCCNAAMPTTRARKPGEPVLSATKDGVVGVCMLAEVNQISISNIVDDLFAAHPYRRTMRNTKKANPVHDRNNHNSQPKSIFNGNASRYWDGCRCRDACWLGDQDGSQSRFCGWLWLCTVAVGVEVAVAVGVTVGVDVGVGVGVEVNFTTAALFCVLIFTANALSCRSERWIVSESLRSPLLA